VFTDTEIGLKIAYDRNLNATVREAQAIIDAKTAQIGALSRALRAARDELAHERALRILSDLRLEELLAQ
jgi:hypothetical protein